MDPLNDLRADEAELRVDPLRLARARMTVGEQQEQADADRAAEAAAAQFEQKLAADEMTRRAEIAKYGHTSRELAEYQRGVEQRRQGRIAELRAELASLDPGTYGDGSTAARFSLLLPDEGEVVVEGPVGPPRESHEGLLARAQQEADAWRSPVIARQRELALRMALVRERGWMDEVEVALRALPYRSGGRRLAPGHDPAHSAACCGPVSTRDPGDPGRRDCTANWPPGQGQCPCGCGAGGGRVSPAAGDW